MSPRDNGTLLDDQTVTAVEDLVHNDGDSGAGRAIASRWCSIKQCTQEEQTTLYVHAGGEMVRAHLDSRRVVADDAHR